MNGSGKHYSLLRYGNNYDRKKLYSTAKGLTVALSRTVFTAKRHCVECRYFECRCDECRGAQNRLSAQKFGGSILVKSL